MNATSLLRSLSLAVCLLCLFSLTGCGIVGTTAQLATRAVGLATLKPLWNCLPEGTKIDTPDGPKAIEHLLVGEMVVGFDGSPVRILQKHSYVEDPLTERFYLVTFKNGTQINLCDKHRIHGIPAEQLAIGDQLKSGHVVHSISTYGDVERSYDLLTEDDGYQIGGIPVNSMINEMLESGLDTDQIPHQ